VSALKNHKKRGHLNPGALLFIGKRFRYFFFFRPVAFLAGALDFMPSTLLSASGAALTAGVGIGFGFSTTFGAGFGAGFGSSFLPQAMNITLKAKQRITKMTMVFLIGSSIRIDFRNAGKRPSFLKLCDQAVKLDQHPI
jgi:hypothetical protein